MTGILASSLVERMMSTDPSASLLAPVLMTLGLASVATGIVLCGFGVSRMGRAIRYVPYPVVGGFLGATGYLILLGAVRVITGQRPQLATLEQFAGIQTLSELAAACLMALVLYLTWHRSRTPFGLPVILIGGVIAAHIVFWLAGISPTQAQASGWTFQPPPHVNFLLPWNADEIGRYPWYAVPDLLGNLIAVIFVTATSTLFNTAGVEVAVDREANLERELNVTGLANMLSGAFGGYTGCISISRSVLSFNSGASGREYPVCAERTPIREHQERKPGARPEAAHLFRHRNGRALDLRQPHHRGAAEVDKGALRAVPTRLRVVGTLRFCPPYDCEARIRGGRDPHGSAFSRVSNHEARPVAAAILRDARECALLRMRWVRPSHPRHHHVFDLDIFVHAVMGAFAAEA
jgi:hypothetical protein